MAEIKTKSVKLNMVMNALLSMSSFIFPLITFPYVSRILLPVGTGRVAFATAVVTYFAMFAQLGIPTYGIRLCAKVRDNKEELTRAVHELLFINLFMSAIVYAVFFISLAVVPKFREEHTLLLIIGATILLNALGVEWLYKALEQYTYITVRSLIFKVVALISTFMLVRDPEDCLQYGFLTILATSASNVLNFINLRKYIYLKPIGGYHIRRHIKMILVFFSMSVATTIYTNLDNVMLGFMKDKVEVGYYSAAVKIKSIMVSVVTSASTVLLPRASYYVDKGMMDEFSRILKKTMHFIFLVAIPFSIYFMIYAKEGIFFLSGKAYAGAIIPMQIIMPTLTLIGISNVTGIQMMVPLGREKQVLYSEIAGAIVDLVLNTIFIPIYGAAGAALGTLVAEAVVLGWQCVAIRDLKMGIFQKLPYGKILVAVGLGSAASFWVKLLGVGVFPTLVISAVCFFGVYGIVMTVLKDSLVIELEKQLIRKIKRMIVSKMHNHSFGKPIGYIFEADSKLHFGKG